MVHGIKGHNAECKETAGGEDFMLLDVSLIMIKQVPMFIREIQEQDWSHHPSHSQF